jgi:VIT1/CCC1 family predicted Fe2+/Mn2+ transporter
MSMTFGLMFLGSFVPLAPLCFKTHRWSSLSRIPSYRYLLPASQNLTFFTLAVLNNLGREKGNRNHPIGCVFLPI